MKNIIVTGSNGFIGKNIAEYFICHGEKVICTHRGVKPAFSISPDKLSGEIMIKQANLADSAQCETLFQDEAVDVVIHLAGEMHSKLVKDYLENSVRATENMIASAEKHGVSTFIFASSVAVYGNTNGIVNENSDKINPDDYAIAKIIGERLLEDSQIPKRIALRLPRVLGKDIHFSRPWIPKLAASLLKNEKVEYYNAELQYSNMAHVDTISEFIQKLICEKADGYEIYGLGAADSKSVKYIAEKLKLLLNSDSVLEEVRKEVRTTWHHIDISKAIKAGYKALSVDETLERFAMDVR